MSPSTPARPPRPGATPRRNPSQERSRARVQAILDATAQVLTDVGLERTSTNKIARQAGMSVGSIYQYFPDKEAVVDALVEDRMGRLGELARTHMAALGDHTFPAAAEAMIRAVIDLFAQEPGLVPVLMSHAVLSSDTGVAGQLRAEASTLARDYLAGLDRLAVTDLAVAVFVATNVAGLFGALLADPAIDEGFRERAITEVVRMLATWMAPPPP